MFAVGSLAMLAALLAGCGQKGPLTLPPPASSSPAASAAPASPAAAR